LLCGSGSGKQGLDQVRNTALGRIALMHQDGTMAGPANKSAAVGLRSKLRLGARRVQRGGGCGGGGTCCWLGWRRWCGQTDRRPAAGCRSQTRRGPLRAQHKMNVDGVGSHMRRPLGSQRPRGKEKKREGQPATRRAGWADDDGARKTSVDSFSEKSSARHRPRLCSTARPRRCTPSWTWDWTWER
jgi:hypothetical protein